MRTLAFDGRTGASGDMLLGALLAAGADPDALAPVEEALPVSYAVGETIRNGVRATTVDVRVDDAGESGGSRDGDDPGDHDHDHGDHDHEHGGEDHGHGENHHEHDDHEHGGEDREAEGAGPHRSYPEVVELVESMDLPPGVAGEATAIFELLGEAEAEVHGTDLAETHFHEVGADDAVADVIGVCLLLADLDVERVVTTPLAAGGGEVSMHHGSYPVPAPAVVNLARRADWELRGGPVEAELLTPTGAAVLARVAEGVETLPTLRVAAAGYGAGDRELPDRPNVLRALVGESRGDLRTEGVAVLETNLDDATPETLGSLQETLAGAGARDVSVLPATMKKSRPGHLVKVVVAPEDAGRVARRLAAETGTLGVREAPVRHRWVADRRFETVVLEVDGERREVTVKVATDAAGAVVDVSAEHDEAAAVARETGLAVREVKRRAEARADAEPGG